MDVLGTSSSTILYSSSAKDFTSTTSSSFSLFSSYSHPFSSSSSSSYQVTCETKFAERVGRFIHVTITCIFAAVGSFIGGLTGGMIGLTTESGLLRGAGIGAISGAVFTIEAFESSLCLWHSNDFASCSVLYVGELVISLFSGRLVRQNAGSAMLNAVRSEMSVVDSPLMEAIDIFDTGVTKGIAQELVDKLPKISISPQNNVDDAGERIRCTFCLQDFEFGETVRCLPRCQHKFHLPCIDSWLKEHGACPLCRRNI